MEIAELCANAEDQAHCGRLIEERCRLKRLPGLVERDGDELARLALSRRAARPSPTATIAVDGRSYSLWDYLDGINAVVLFATDGDQTRLRAAAADDRQRSSDLPSEPTLVARPPAPRHRRFLRAAAATTRSRSGASRATACARSSRGSRRVAWTDAGATWKDADTLRIEYTAADGAATIARRLTDPTWTRRAVSWQ